MNFSINHQYWGKIEKIAPLQQNHPHSIAGSNKHYTLEIRVLTFYFQLQFTK
jgi:hypothetical protein